MQRLFSLALLAALLGGGWMFLQGWGPEDIKQAVRAGAAHVGQGGGQGGWPQQGPAPPQQAGGAPAPYVPATPAAGTTIRVASYNIQMFGESKASKPYVMSTIAGVVQQFDIVAIQEIRTKDEYFIDNFLRAYVNRNGRRYSRVVGPRLGRSSSKEQYAFLYDTETVELNPRMVYTVRDHQDDLLHREPLVAMFRTRAVSPNEAFTFMLINTHTDPDETDTELDALAQVYRSVWRGSGGEDDVILLGDLNTDVPAAPPYQVSNTARGLRPSDLRGLGQIPGIYPVIRNQSTNTVGTRLHDNILIHRGATTEFTGQAGVYDVQRAINRTQEDALLVSDHLPVWAEFSVYESSSPGRLATRPGAAPSAFE